MTLGCFGAPGELNDRSINEYRSWTTVGGMIDRSVITTLYYRSLTRLNTDIFYVNVLGIIRNSPILILEVKIFKQNCIFY